MNKLRLLFPLFSLLCFAPLALAHPGHLGEGLADGFLHSLSVFDYAMLILAGGGLWLSFN